MSIVMDSHAIAFLREDGEAFALPVEKVGIVISKHLALDLADPGGFALDALSKAAIKEGKFVIPNAKVSAFEDEFTMTYRYSLEVADAKKFEEGMGMTPNEWKLKQGTITQAEYDSALAYEPIHGIQSHSHPAPNTYYNTSPNHIGGETIQTSIARAVPAMSQHVACPACDTHHKTLLPNLIVHLNDSQRWSREQIADWLETLDLDITFHPPEERKTA